MTAVAWGSRSLRDANARWMPRPPGAVDGKDFLALCSRCGQCVPSCPYETLRLAGPFAPAPGGTPRIEVTQQPYTMYMSQKEAANAARFIQMRAVPVLRRD